MPACSHTISDGNWKIGVYKVSDTNWRLGKAAGQNGSSYIEGEGVLDLRSLEEDCGVVLKTSSNGGLERVTTITAVYFPDCFEAVDGATFNSDNTAASTQLETVVFGSGIKRIGDKAFYNCTKLKTINFPEGLESIGYQSFAGCSSLVLQEGGFPESLTKIGHNAFANCQSLVSGLLDLKNVSTITGTHQFEKITTITEVRALNLATVSEGMFSNCSGLKSATFSPDLKSIGGSAFQGTALVSFSPTALPKFETIGHGAFRGLRNLATSFDFTGSKLKTVPTYALVDLEKVSEIRFPETLEELASEAMAYNRNVRVVRFAGPPPTMGSSAVNSNSGSAWYFIVGPRHAAEWKASEHLAELTESDKASASYPGKKDVKEKWGLSGTRPIGRWNYQSGTAAHWVVEELPTGTTILIR